MSGRLQGKVAIITGAASGMGLATARRFAAEGAKVLIADIRDELGQAAAAELGDAGAFIHCDVTQEAEIAAAVAAAVERFGGLDIMFANAGFQGTIERIEHMPVDGWDHTMNVLMRGPMLCIKHAVPALRARGGGAIIVTASTAGMRAGMGTAAYAVGKSGAIMVAQMAAGELAADSIRVNCICPGFIVTPIFGRALGESDSVAQRMTTGLAQKFGAMQPLPRAGMPEDVAEAALFLASDASKFVTGLELKVDGGQLIGEAFKSDESENFLVNLLGDVRDKAAAAV